MMKRTISIIMAIILIAGMGAGFAAEQAVDMTESEYANIPDTRDGEYINGITFENIFEYFHVPEEDKASLNEIIEQGLTEDEIADIMTWMLTVNNRYTIFILAEYLFSEELNDYIIVDAFDKSYLMDSNYENIDMSKLKEYVGNRTILEIRPNMTVDSISSGKEGVEFLPYLFQAIEKVDGKTYYNLEVLRIGYGKLNPENLPVKYVKQKTDAE